MNSPSNAESGPRSPTPATTLPSDSGASDAGSNTAAPRPFYWSVWRELWENRSIYIAPLAVAVVVLFGFMISTYGMPERRRGVLLMDPAKQQALISEPYDGAAMMLIFTVFIVGVFYCLDALYGERRDRSILFWKSLPVSDLTTVLSKVSIPLVILPLVTFVIIVATQFVMLLWSSVVLLTSGLAGTTWTRFNIARAVADITLQLDRAGALARADLRLAPADFRLGAAGDFSLGGNTAVCDQHFRKDHLQHHAFYQNAGEPPDRIRGGGL